MKIGRLMTRLTFVNANRKRPVFEPQKKVSTEWSTCLGLGLLTFRSFYAGQSERADPPTQ